MRRVCVSGLRNQAGEQSWFRDVLEGALAVLSSHLCPAATAGSSSQVLCAEGWFWLETNPRPLLLPNHFLQQVLSHIQSSNKVLATALHGKYFEYSQNMAQNRDLHFYQFFCWKSRRPGCEELQQAKRSLLCPPRCSQRKRNGAGS